MAVPPVRNCKSFGRRAGVRTIAALTCASDGHPQFANFARRGPSGHNEHQRDRLGFPVRQHLRREHHGDLEARHGRPAKRNDHCHCGYDNCGKYPENQLHDTGFYRGLFANPLQCACGRHRVGRNCLFQREHGGIDGQSSGQHLFGYAQLRASRPNASGQDHRPLHHLCARLDSGQLRPGNFSRRRLTGRVWAGYCNHSNHRDGATQHRSIGIRWIADGCCPDRRSTRIAAECICRYGCRGESPCYYGLQPEIRTSWHRD